MVTAPAMSREKRRNAFVDKTVESNCQVPCSSCFRERASHMNLHADVAQMENTIIQSSDPALEFDRSRSWAATQASPAVERNSRTVKGDFQVGRPGTR